MKTDTIVMAAMAIMYRATGQLSAAGRRKHRGGNKRGDASKHRRELVADGRPAVANASAKEFREEARLRAYIAAWPTGNDSTMASQIRTVDPELSSQK